MDCAFRGRSVGRALMQAVIDYAQHNGIARVRLMQETINTLSLSLYASIGFEVQEEVAFMEAAPADAADYSVRAATEAVSLMTLGPYEPPRQVWMSSVLY